MGYLFTFLTVSFEAQSLNFGDVHLLPLLRTLVMTLGAGG